MRSGEVQGKGEGEGQSALGSGVRAGGGVGVSSRLVQRQQRLHQELLVLLLEGQREAVDDGAEDLEQLGDT